jgi:S1-C subfamily serine protease
MSLSNPKQRFPLLPQIASYGLTIALSVGVTLAALHAFPILVPGEVTGSPKIQAAASNDSTPPSPVAKHNFVSAAVNRVGPAVVRIDTEKTIARPPDPFFDDPFFRGFFGQDLPKLPKEYRQYGEGSGFIIDRDGIILTNAHVVSGVDQVKVTLKDGRTFQGKVQGIDGPSDLAVVKIKGNNLPVAPLGNFKEVQVGDWAIAVGNPFGLGNTVTLGIVSNLRRSSAQVGIPDKRLDFLQTDAAINPGNSGGPLLNEQGEVIGINTAIRAEAQGIGFAIPIDTAKEIKDRLARGEKIPHPYLGLRMLTLTPEIAKQLNRNPDETVTVPEISGVLVVGVVTGGPAAAAGLRQGDVITEVNGQVITNADQLQDLVAKSSINQALPLKIQRGEQSKQLSVRPGELQDAARSE